jgi:chromosome segregation ATPase
MHVKRKQTDEQLMDMARALAATESLTVEALREMAGGGDRKRLMNTVRLARAEMEVTSAGAELQEMRLPAGIKRMVDLLVLAVDREFARVRIAEADRARVYEEDLREKQMASEEVLSDALSTALAERDALDEQLRAGNDHLREVKERAAALDAQLSAEAEERRRQAEMHQKALEHLQNALAASRMDTARAEEERLQASLERERSIARAERREEELATAEARLTAREEEISALRDQASRWRSEVETVRQEIGTLQEERKTLTTDTAAARARIAELEGQIGGEKMLAELLAQLPSTNGGARAGEKKNGQANGPGRAGRKKSNATVPGTRGGSGRIHDT